MEFTTREKLAWTAAKLFQEKGYHGAGLAEILKATGLPKGSLYHHFPNGKSDLALEAAALAHRETTRIIDDAFRDASSYRDGATTLFYKLAKLFDVMGKHTGCPISNILFAGPDHDAFRQKSAEYFQAWMNQIADHAEKLGEPRASAETEAQRLFLVLQGGWTLARATENSDAIRSLPALFLFKNED
ncbi:MAG: TetR/AcrR family transcriptional regulator [Pseudomonadota bacterium]